MATSISTSASLEESVSRWLGAVFGPLGPVEGAKAYNRALDLAREKGTNIAAVCEEIVFGHGENIPDYLKGYSRSEFFNQTSNWVRDYVLYRNIDENKG